MIENEKFAFLLILEENYWNTLGQNLDLRKRPLAFVRRNVVGPIDTQLLLFYVKKPKMQILGIADFIERVIGDPQDLWNM
ncbi:MAG: hypothetical protein GX638_10545, partial [Crenarchaeota archaeon]|nr:hypothetical protein [Thermoproteota archaeon]